MDKSDVFNQLKEEYGRIFTVELGKQEYVLRPLTLVEIESFRNQSESQSGITSAEIEDKLVMTSIIYPFNFNMEKMKAGHVSAMAEKIAEVSGISSINAIQAYILERRQAASTDYISDFKAFILAVLPAYKEEDLDLCSVYQLVDKVILCEKIVKTQQQLAQMGPEAPILFNLEVETEKPVEETQPRRKDKLLQQMRDVDKETAQNRQFINNDAFEQFDEDTLERMQGKVSANDPFAQRLREALQ